MNLIFSENCKPVVGSVRIVCLRISGVVIFASKYDSSKSFSFPDMTVCDFFKKISGNLNLIFSENFFVPKSVVGSIRVVSGSQELRVSPPNMIAQNLLVFRYDVL